MVPWSDPGTSSSAQYGQHPLQTPQSPFPVHGGSCLPVPRSVKVSGPSPSVLEGNRALKAYFHADVFLQIFTFYTRKGSELLSHL